MKRPSRVFVCSMADLFGAWVPDDWIGAVFETVGSCPRHTFHFLARNPARYASLGLPANAWHGTTVDRASVVDRIDALRGLEQTTFVSFEPLVEEVNPDLAGIDAVLIGARTQPLRLPPRAWVDRIVTRAREAGAAVFMKDNLARFGLPLLRESGRHGPARPRRLSRALRPPGRAAGRGAGGSPGAMTGTIELRLDVSPVRGTKRDSDDPDPAPQFGIAATRPGGTPTGHARVRAGGPAGASTIFIRRSRH